MPEQIIIGGPTIKGQKTYYTAFNIDNDAFLTLFNAYAWRGRVKRKRGTKYLGRLTRQMQIVASPNAWQVAQFALVGGVGNLLQQFGLSPVISVNITGVIRSTNTAIIANNSFSPNQFVLIQNVVGTTQLNGNVYQIAASSPTSFIINVNSTGFSNYISGGTATLQLSQASLVPGTINLVVSGDQTYTDPNKDGTLTGSLGGTGTINYATGFFSVSGSVSGNVTGTFSYYPSLPVMGLEDFSSSISSSQYPVLLAFDTTYSYQCNQASEKANFYSTSYYKQSNNPLIWSGKDYQQFWTTNYPSTTTNFSGSLWATNNKPGFHYLVGTYVSGSGTDSITFDFVYPGTSTPYTSLVAGSSMTGDVLWFNEWTSTGLNNQTGYVSTNNGGGQYVVTFPTAITVSDADTGIAQTLTNSVPVVAGMNFLPQDGIRWYDGDPTSGTGLPTGTGKGWVNFAPPLTAAIVSIDGTPEAKYYLVGALAIVPFKDRLLFFSPYIQSSVLNGQSGIIIQLQDTVLWSWNGTPYYAALVPTNQSFNPMAYYVDQTGLGNYLPAGISSPIITVGNNEDVLLVGFGGDGRKTRLVYTGNDLQPFLFFNINSELPSQSTFSAIILDKGMVDIGQYGIVMTDQQSAQRIDLDIPDSVFTIQSLNNGAQRVTAIRDFYREWVYFSYPTAYSTTLGNQTVFPTQSFLFNYRDNTWGVLYENFTHYGYYRASSKKTWLTLEVDSWNTWREAWNSGINSALQTEIIAGNPQGYVLIKSQDTTETRSGSISAIANSGGATQITSYNHCVTDNNYNTDTGDYLYFTGALGISPWNGLIGKVLSVIDVNNFVVDVNFPSGTYLGLGQFTRLSQPLIQTKMFNPYWSEGRQVRLCAQKYLLDKTTSSQVTVEIYLSQDADSPYNDNTFNPPPNGLVYSETVFTCPESTNLGLTPWNVNLQNQLPTGSPQGQIWHRMNTSLIGDSFQIGITLDDAQMRNLQYATDEIVVHGMQFTIERSSLLA